jgi:hypothetical protein
MKDEATANCIKPRVVAEVIFSEWANGGEMRHLAVLGARTRSRRMLSSNGRRVSLLVTA